MKTGRIFIGLWVFFSLPAFTLETMTTYTSTITLQPTDERSAQDDLPKAKDALWDTLYKTKVKVDDKTGTYSATFPDDVKKLNGKTVKISGFMLPLENTEKFKHFLLSRRTPTCFFCPPGAPNEIVEVYASKPTEWIEDLVTYEGKFELMENKEMGVFFKMTNAVKK
jgi:hypothetical protein